MKSMNADTSLLRVLLVEDSEDDAFFMTQYLRRLGVEITLLRVETPAELSAALATRRWDLVISDYRMPKFSGLAALKLVREYDKELPFIIVSATIGEDIAVDAMRAGANDYVMKNNLARLLPAMQREIHEAKTRADSRAANIAQQKQLDYMAYYDSITGLATRTLFLERVTGYLLEAANHEHGLAVCLIDLERFKNINDSVGWSVGDVLLRQVAEWLTDSAGDNKHLARVGANHFALVMPAVKQDGDVIRLFDEKRRAFLGHAFPLNNVMFHISFKAGLAVFPQDGIDAVTLFKHAEVALKSAKATSEPYMLYLQSMSDAASGKLSLENKLRQALDNHEFVLHYQPKVNLATGKLTSGEALIRWNDPVRGLVLPGEFISILEETGLIHDVGRWALGQAVDDYLRWQRLGLSTVRIAVNVSAMQLRQRNFVGEIQKVTDKDPLAAGGLELEITESLIMEDVKHSIASLQAIRALGVAIAIDDFGTGYSSLSYLSKLPLDELKIDRSFVNDMTSGHAGELLVSTIIALAHSLNLKVVAEGVETEEQARMLRSLGCDEMQGHLFCKPVSVEIFEARFLAAGRQS